MPLESATLHLHLDESGTLRFTRTASRYYIFAVVWTYNPRPLALELQLLRFHLLKQGKDLERFHAGVDSWKTRNLVIGKILEHQGWKFTAAVVQKNKVPPKQRENLGSFYSRYATVPLKFLLRGPIRNRAHQLLVYTDRLPTECSRDLTEKAIKKACRAELPTGLPFYIHHHASSSNYWLQVADYCAWAVARKWEQDKRELYSRLRRRLAQEELDILRSETTSTTLTNLRRRPNTYKLKSGG